MADVLYVWANPLRRFKRFDHTWVTSYDAPFSCTKGGPPPHYWYCWGACHAAGPGTTARLLSSAPADLGTAHCLCKPDDAVARPGRASVGGINLYGIQGVCHQLANRILFATTTSPPLTVTGARGYDDSRDVFGTYGKNVREWRHRVKRCTGRDIAFPTVPEEFMTRLRQELPNLSQATRDELQRTHSRLLQYHEELCIDALAGTINGRSFADATNDIYQEARQAWAATINTNDFLFFFQTTPGEPVNIIDPDIAASIDYTSRHAEPSRSHAPAVPVAKRYRVKRTRAAPFMLATKKAAKAKRAVAMRKPAAPKSAARVKKAARAARKSRTAKRG